ncbi:MAG: hypothetical protein JWN78_2459 [Bacteroidota bacterium]|nr:hypothetical protein [Bacteroidota bacterium]
MKNTDITKAFCIALLFIHQLSIAQSNWKLTKAKDGIVVYQTQKAPSKNLDSKVELIINHSTEDILNCLTNFDNYKMWNSNCTRSKLIKKIDNNHWIYYSVFSAPFIQDRELYAKVTLTTTADKSIIHMEACPEFAAINKDCIRINNFYCDYILKDSGGGKTNITLTTSIDMSGSLSVSMVNKFSAGSLLTTFLNFREQLNKSVSN